MSTSIIMRVQPSLPESSCVICFELYTIETSIQFKCLHDICIACYEKLVNQHSTIHCPLCRELVESVEPVQTIQNTESHADHRFYHCCSNYLRELVCYTLLLGGISAFLVMK
jgi:hypothetical protein